MESNYDNTARHYTTSAAIFFHVYVCFVLFVMQTISTKYSDIYALILLFIFIAFMDAYTIPPLCWVTIINCKNWIIVLG